MSKHKHSELIKCWADGALIEVLNGQDWEYKKTPAWVANMKYRIKDDISIRSWKAHSENIIAWWNGAIVEIKSYGEWRLWNDHSACWSANNKYRTRTALKIRLKKITFKKENNNNSNNFEGVVCLWRFYPNGIEEYQRGIYHEVKVVSVDGETWDYRFVEYDDAMDVCVNFISN